MTRLLLIPILILAADALRKSKRCPIEDLRTCPHFDLISEPRFHGFTSNPNFELHCRNIQQAMTCVLQMMQWCSPIETLPFDTQHRVIEMICDKRKHEYLNSQPCLNRLDVKESFIRNCLKSQPIGKKLETVCSDITKNPSCAYDLVLRKENCSTTDALLMRDLISSFIQPTVSVFSCPPLDRVAEQSTPQQFPETKPSTKVPEIALPSNSRTSLNIEPVKIAIEKDVSYILQAVQPKIKISGLPPCDQRPLVQINNYIFINSPLWKADNLTEVNDKSEAEKRREF